MSIQKSLVAAILLLPYQVIADIENNEVTELSREQLINVEVFTASRFTQKYSEFDDTAGNSSAAKNLNHEENRNLFTKLQWSNWPLNESKFNNGAKLSSSLSFDDGEYDSDYIYE